MSTPKMSKPETRELAAKRWPRLAAHLICESLGYLSPSAAGYCLKEYANGRPFHCEWFHDAAGKAIKYGHEKYLGLSFDEIVTVITKEAVISAFKRRHRHKGSMAEYHHARRLMWVYNQSNAQPNMGLASWF